MAIFDLSFFCGGFTLIKRQVSLHSARVVAHCRHKGGKMVNKMVTQKTKEIKNNEQRKTVLRFGKKEEERGGGRGHWGLTLVQVIL